MGYRYDSDLEIFQECSSEELNDLVQLLIYDKDGAQRITENLTSFEEYKKYSPDHKKYWQKIAEEIQHYGGNSFVNVFRGTGVLYREVLYDVCDKMKVNYNKNASTMRIEDQLLGKLLEEAIEKMDDEERRKLAKEIGLNNTASFSAESLMGCFFAVFQMGGFKSYQLTVIVANAILKALVGRGLSFGGNMVLTRTASILTGPIGWVIAGLWTAVDIAGPAYRVTIPAVIQVAYLRKLVANRENVQRAEQVKF